MKSFTSRVRQAILRFLLHHWAGMLLVIFSLLALLTAYQMWRAGPVGALSFLPQLVICLILIVAVVVARRVVNLGKGGLAKGAASLQTHVAKEAVQESLSQGQTVLKGKVEEAKGALSALGEEVKGDLQQLAGGQLARSPTMPQSAPRCPSCNRFVRAGAKFCDGCGAPLPATCPQCGRALRPQAKFCDGCGARIRTAH
jgi:hypothetical protein